MNHYHISDTPNAPDIESSTRGYQRRFDGAVGAWFLQQQDISTSSALKTAFSKNIRLAVLDVGGGHGQNIALMNKLGHEITIVGSNESCREAIAESVAAGDAAFVTAPLLQLPFEDSSFDVVICYRVLSHMEEWEELLRELTRVAKHLVLVDYPNKMSVNIVGNLFFSLKKKIEGNTRRYQSFGNGQIKTIFAENGFVRIYQRNQFFLPMALHRMIGKQFLSRIVSGVFRLVGLTALFGSPSVSGYTKLRK